MNEIEWMADVSYSVSENHDSRGGGTRKFWAGINRELECLSVLKLEVCIRST